MDTLISYVNWLTRTTVEIYTVKFKASSFCFVACTTHISETLSYITMPNTCITSIKAIANYCSNPEMVEEVIKRGIDQTMKLVTSRNVFEMMRKLKRGKVGTNEVMCLSGRMCSRLGNSRRETLVDTVMKWKVRDARKQFNRDRYENTKVWREIKPILHEHGVTRQYEELWAQQKEKFHTEERRRVNKKVSFLREKYTAAAAPRDYSQVHGVDVTDTDIPEDFESTPRLYGTCSIDDNETALLSLPPKFATYNKVNEIDVEAQVEKSFAKLRWDIGNPPDVDENGNPMAETREHYYNIAENTFDFRVMRATELPFNKSIKLPYAVEQEDEIAMQDLKNRLLRVTTQYNNDNHLPNNLSKTEQTGLRSLKAKTRDGDVVIFKTDKSSRFSVDSAENYKRACDAHVRNDEVVTLTDHDKMEKQLSSHAVVWSRMLNAGHELGQTDRVKNNMISKSSPIAPMYGLRKDHKIVADGQKEEGPPVRPVCGANSSHNRKLSHILSTLLKPVWMNPGNVTCCLSTEEMIAAIERVNDTTEGRPIIVGSADVKALYPSLDIDFTVDKVCELFRDSKVEVEGADYDEVGLYLALNTDRQQRIALGIDNVCPTREHSQGNGPKITASGRATDREKRFKSWKRPTTKPEPSQQRVMLVEALRIALKLVMDNHMYEFDNEIRRQTSGGAIGLELTGTIAQVFMVWYDKQIVNKLTEIGLEPLAYKRYVDDINAVLPETQLGAVFRNGEMVVDDTLALNDMNCPADARVMRIH